MSTTTVLPKAGKGRRSAAEQARYQAELEAFCAAILEIQSSVLVKTTAQWRSHEVEGRLMRLWIALVGLVLLAGCANFTSQQLRADTTPVRTFDVAQPYQAVYRTILMQARTCYAGSILLNPIMVEGELFPDTASGQIAVNLYRVGQMVALFAVDVSALSSMHTRVVIYAYWSAQAKRAPTIEAWVTRGATDC